MSGTLSIFFFNDTATTEIYTLSLHDALPICGRSGCRAGRGRSGRSRGRPSSRERPDRRSEEHTSELQSRVDLVCRLLLEKKKEQDNEVRPTDVGVNTGVARSTQVRHEARATT